MLSCHPKAPISRWQGTLAIPLRAFIYFSVCFVTCRLKSLAPGHNPVNFQADTGRQGSVGRSRGEASPPSPHHTQGTVIHCNVLGEAAFKDSGWDSCYQRTPWGLSTGPSRIFWHHLLTGDLGWGNVLSLTRLSFTPSFLTLLSLWALGP